MKRLVSIISTKDKTPEQAGQEAYKAHQNYLKKYKQARAKHKRTKANRTPERGERFST